MHGNMPRHPSSAQAQVPSEEPKYMDKGYIEISIQYLIAASPQPLTCQATIFALGYLPA